jgi:hypothetical protein
MKLAIQIVSFNDGENLPFRALSREVTGLDEFGGERGLECQAAAPGQAA